MRNRVTILSLSLACLIATSFGCGVSSTPSSNPDVNPDTKQTPPPVIMTDAASGQVCEPGKGWQNCICPNGETSVKICCADGMSYGVCICGSASPNSDALAPTNNDAAPAPGPICLIDGQFPSSLAGQSCSPKNGDGNGIFVCRKQANGLVIPTCEPNQVPVVNPDAAVVNDTAVTVADAAIDAPLPQPDTIVVGPEVQADIAPSADAIVADTLPNADLSADADTGTVAAPDATFDTKADSGVCVEQTIIGNQCFNELTNRFGFTVCKNGREQCVFYTPPSPNDCDYVRESEIDYFSSCSFKPGCDNGSFVCRDGSWKCELLMSYYYWYVVPQCMPQPDAGTDEPTGTGGSSGTGGAVGTGGVVGTGGSTGTGGSSGTGGVIGTGGDITGTGGVVGTGGVIGTGGSVGTGGLVGTGGVIGTGGNISTGGATGTGGFANNWPLINCINTDATGAFVNLTLVGPIDGIDSMGTPNLVDLQSFNSGLTSPQFCVVGNYTGWFTRNYCVPWTNGQTSVTVPSIQVRALAVTEVNYVIDYANGQMIWGRNTNLSYAADTSTSVNRCAFGGDSVNLIVKANTVPTNGGG